MTEFDRASLDRILPSAPRPADWDDVLSRSREHQHGRRRLFVVVVAAALVALAAASAFATRAFHSERVGFIGIPPEGATPSSPARGKLMLSFFGAVPAKITWTDRKWGRSLAWVYADGRLIWLREDDRPFGANHISTGYLEQRLTPAGAELFRSKILLTGLFRLDRPRVFGYPTVQVREGGRLLNHGPLSPRDGRKLSALFADPASWLPARSWKDRKIRAYVPSRFAVSYGGGPNAIAASRIFSLLPTSVADLLRPRERTRSGKSYVSIVRTEEARALAEALADAHLERIAPAWLLGYRLEVPGEPQETIFISFEPILPHGKWACSPCG